MGVQDWTPPPLAQFRHVELGGINKGLCFWLRTTGSTNNAPSFDDEDLAPPSVNKYERQAVPSSVYCRTRTEATQGQARRSERINAAVRYQSGLRCTRNG